MSGHSSPQAQSHLILPWEEGKGFDIKARIELYHEKGAVARSAEERVVLEDLHSLCGRGESPPDEGGKHRPSIAISSTRRRVKVRVKTRVKGLTR